MSPEKTPRMIGSVPKLWTHTIEAHRREVGDAILDATGTIVAEHGLRAVTMSQVADKAGIGRATLYKYFPDLDGLLTAWHRREVAGHLARLVEVRDAAGGRPLERFLAVLEAYAFMAYEAGWQHDAAAAAMLHRDPHLEQVHGHVDRLIRDLVDAAIADGSLRDDLRVPEVAAYCVNALQAASSARSKAAVRRLVALVVDGLRATE